MSDQHPWADAAGSMPLSPVPTSVKMESVSVTDADTQNTEEAALLVIATPSGVTTVFLPPTMLNGLLLQGAEILREWQTEQNNKLIIANPQTQGQFLPPNGVRKI